jgi:hypothetical protein
MISMTRPTLITVDYTEILTVREKVQRNSPDLMPSVNEMLKEADDYLKLPPDSVVHKSHIPPSGDKHDFFAIGKYAWPNPDTPDGMPYIRRDGYINPASSGNEYDLKGYKDMRIRVNTLTFAYFFTGSEAYAAKAAELLRVWFLNPDTQMNPNFNFASSLPGVYDGMPIGIIEGVQLIALLDSVQLLLQSQLWTQADNDALKLWFEAYSDWMLTSPNGKIEARSTTNHGSWYAAQIAAFSIYTGNLQQARQIIPAAHYQIDVQFDANGGLHSELRRNRALLYSLFGMNAFVALARCGEVVGEDLWHYETTDGRGIELGFRFLSPYLSGEIPWAWQNIDNEINALAGHIVRCANKVYTFPDLAAASKHLDSLRPRTDWPYWLMTGTMTK